MLYLAILLILPKFSMFTFHYTIFNKLKVKVESLVKYPRFLFFQPNNIYVKKNSSKFSVKKEI